MALTRNLYTHQSREVMYARREKAQLTLPTTSEEHPDHKDLQPSHGNNQPTLNKTEIPNPALRTPDRAEIPILPRPEILLLPTNTRQKATDFDNALFQRSRLFGRTALFARDSGAAHFVLDGDFEIDHFLRESGDCVVEAEAVFARICCGEDVVCLALFFAREDYFVVRGAVDCVVDCLG